MHGSLVLAQEDEDPQNYYSTHPRKVFCGILAAEYNFFLANLAN